MIQLPFCEVPCMENKSKPADEQSSIGYLPGMEFFSYLEYMKRLYLYKLPQMRSEDPGDLVLEFSKRRMHIEYLEAIQKKFKKYQREVKKMTGFGYKVMNPERLRRTRLVKVSEVKK